MRETKLILADRKADFLAAAKKLQGRARRHKLTEAMFEFAALPCLEWREFTDWDGSTRKTLVELLGVHILAGEPIKAAGWTFIARLERLGDEVLAHTVPGCEIALADDQRDAGSRCDHCNTVRQRKDVYVVAHEDGRQMRVGSTCLRDFLGCDTPAKLAARFEFFSAMRDLCGGDGWVAPTCSMLGYITAVATQVRLQGFMSRARASQIAEAGGHASTTAGIISTAMWGESTEADKVKAMLKKAYVEADAEQAQAVIAFWAGVVAPQSEYEGNLAKLMRLDTVSAKHGGLVASSISGWARATGVALGPQKDERPSEWQGAVGERLRNVAVTIADKRGFEGRFGYTVLVKMRDVAGNAFAWFASGAASADLRTGESYTIDATVKAHGEHKGLKETALSRCAISKPAAPKAKKRRPQTPRRDAAGLEIAA